ncbi:MAG: leucyl aminopeptidase family protein [Armatimonadota bacterium]
MPTPFEIQTLEGSIFDFERAALILPIFQGGPAGANEERADAALGGLLTEMREQRELRPEPGQVLVIPTLGRLPAPRLALVGLGSRESCSRPVVVRAVAAACRALGKRGLAEAAIDAADLPLGPDAAGAAAAEGAELSRFIADLYRTGERKEVQLRTLYAAGTSDSALRDGAARGRAKNFARELTVEPGNVVDPPELARRAEAMAAATGLQFECLDEAAMQRLGMEAILTVTRGSETPACFILLRHFPAGKRREGTPLLALIGKAVTFDTGGISLKPVAEMGRMKGDMAGGAAVIGAMQAIAELRVDLDVLALVPAAVNMPDGRAWKPGDVVKTRDGLTVETITTDAEGRMLLADALSYARELGATHLVDIATLTGACVVGLGHHASGLFSTDPALCEAVRECGEEAGERHWPLPLFPEYREQIRSEIADLKNSGGRPGGAITAAMFLKEFAGDLPWAHVDIAGTSHYEKARPWAPAGPTGIGVGTFVNLAQCLAAGELR